jgi:hypothetical protein
MRLLQWNAQADFWPRRSLEAVVIPLKHGRDGRDFLGKQAQA